MGKTNMIVNCRNTKTGGYHDDTGEDIILGFDENGNPTHILGCRYAITKDEIRAEAVGALKEGHAYKIKFEGENDANVYCNMKTEVEHEEEKGYEDEEDEEDEEEDEDEEEEDEEEEVEESKDYDVKSKTFYPCIFAEAWKDLKRSPDYKDHENGPKVEEELIEAKEEGK